MFKKIFFFIFAQFFLIAAIFASGEGQKMTQDHDNNKEATFDYKDQPDDFWKSNLSEPIYAVCRLSSTERAGTGKFDKFYEEGTYYCACCGGDHAVYSSNAKFDSGTGWPSFYEPIKDGIVERSDPHDKILGFLGLARTEVICSRCGSHLGHVFNDGPKPTGKRYCMNSVALSFTPAGQQPKRTFDVKQ